MVTLKTVENELEDDLKDDLDELDIEITELDLEVDETDTELDVELLLKATADKPMQSAITRYLYDIHQFPRLSSDEEIELAKVIKVGVEAKALLTEANQAELTPIILAGQQAREKFINANYKLVVSVAKRFNYAVTASFGFLDIIQSGNLGLMIAVDRFDYTKGFKFSTYATAWIRQRIRRDLINTGQTIRIPVHMQDLITKINLYKNNNKSLTNEEIAKALDITVDKLIRVLRLQEEVSTVSLDQVIATEGGDANTILDMLPSDTLSPDKVDTIESRDQFVYKVLCTRLTDREHYVINRRYGLVDGKPVTLEVVGKELNVTRERIRQIEAKAMRKLRSERVKKSLANLLNEK